MAKTVNKKQTIQLADGQFFVNPKEIFCGDKVTLQYQTVLTDANAIILGNVLPIKISDSEQLAKIIKIDSLDCTLENFELSISGNLLTSQINFVPWRLGKLSYPTVKLELESIIIELPGSEFSVSSILEATGETSVKPAMGPILLPGTTYIVYGSIFLGIILLSLLIFTLTKSSKIIRFFKNIIIARRYKKNYKKSLAMLKKLGKNSQNISYKEFAEELQKIMRSYFAFRFSDKIYNLATAEIVGWFNSVYNLILPEQAETAIHLFYEIMLRCDFLRFSGNSVEEGNFKENENIELIQKASKIMELIEKGSSDA